MKTLDPQTKIAIYYDNRISGRNDGAPLYYYYVLLNKLKLQTYHLIPTGDTRKDIGTCQYHFWIDWGEDALQYPEWKIPDDGGKKIYVSSDTHLGRNYRFEKAKEFDYVFFNQKRAVKEYLAENKRKQVVAWLPHAAEPDSYPHFEIIKRYDLCFVGHMQPDRPNYNVLSRVGALDRMFKEFPNFYYGSRHPAYPGRNLFEDAAKRFCESKICFNISIQDDINMRVFETMMTGSFLLTNWLPTLEDLFGDYEGKYFVTYKTYNEAVEKARYYLEHDEEREKIALAGYNEVLKHHTYERRIQSIFDIINK